MSTETDAAPKMTNPSCDRCRHGWDSHSDEDGHCFRCSCDQYDGKYAEPLPTAPVEPTVTSYEVEHECEGNTFVCIGMTAEQADARRDELLADDTVTAVKVTAFYR